MRTTLMIAVLILAAGFSFAKNDVPVRKLEGEPVTTTFEKAEALSGTVQDPVQIANRKALNVELEASRLASQNEVATLVEELQAAVTGEDRMAFQKRISAVKQMAWRDNLAIQMKYAELGGFTKQAQELQVRIQRLDDGIASPQAAQSGSLRNSASNEGGAR